MHRERVGDVFLARSRIVRCKYKRRERERESTISPEAIEGGAEEETIARSAGLDFRKFGVVVVGKAEQLCRFLGIRGRFSVVRKKRSSGGAFCE